MLLNSALQQSYEIDRFDTIADLFAQWGGFIAVLTFAFNAFAFFNSIKFHYYFTWDLEPFQRGKEKSVATAHRVLDAKLIPLSVKGEPFVLNFKKQDPPLLRRKKKKELQEKNNSKTANADV